jgi:hypothetical protein
MLRGCESGNANALAEIKKVAPERLSAFSSTFAATRSRTSTTAAAEDAAVVVIVIVTVVAVATSIVPAAADVHRIRAFKDLVEFSAVEPHTTTLRTIVDFDALTVRDF